MNKMILQRSYPNGICFEIDVTDMSFTEFIDLLKEKAKLRGTMTVRGNGVNLVIDNHRFFGRIDKKE